MSATPLTTAMPPSSPPPSLTPAQIAKAVAATVATLALLDAVWIGAVGPALGVDFVNGVIPAVTKGGTLVAKPVPALLAYASMTAAVVRSALRGGCRGVKAAACRAAETGFYIYSVFEATNAFMFSAAWPARAVVLDSAWGAALFGAAGAAAAAAAGLA